MQESKHEATKVAFLVKMAENLTDASRFLKYVEID